MAVTYLLPECIRVVIPQTFGPKTELKRRHRPLGEMTDIWKRQIWRHANYKRHPYRPSAGYPRDATDMFCLTWKNVGGAALKCRTERYRIWRCCGCRCICTCASHDGQSAKRHNQDVEINYHSSYTDTAKTRWRGGCYEQAATRRAPAIITARRVNKSSFTINAAS